MTSADHAANRKKAKRPTRRVRRAARRIFQERPKDKST